MDLKEKQSHPLPSSFSSRRETAVVAGGGCVERQELDGGAKEVKREVWPSRQVPSS